MTLKGLNNTEDFNLFKNELTEFKLKFTLTSAFNFYKTLGKELSFLDFLIDISKKNNFGEFKDFINNAKFVTEDNLILVIDELKDKLPFILKEKNTGYRTLNEVDFTENKAGIILDELYSNIELKGSSSLECLVHKTKKETKRKMYDIFTTFIRILEFKIKNDIYNDFEKIGLIKENIFKYVGKGENWKKVKDIKNGLNYLIFEKRKK